MVAEGIEEAVAIAKKEPVTQRDSNYLTRKEAAKRLTISLPTLSKYSLEGLIPCYRIGSRVLYKEEEIDKALELVHSQKFKAFK